MIDRSPRTGFEVGRRPAAAQAVPKRVGPSVSAKPAASRARGFGANKVNALGAIKVNGRIPTVFLLAAAYRQRVLSHYQPDGTCRRNGARRHTTSEARQARCRASADRNLDAGCSALFADMLSLPNDGRYPALELTSEQRRQRTLDALAAQLPGLARQKPLLMVIEDTHWIDPTSLEVFGRTVDQIKTLPGLLANWRAKKPANALALLAFVLVAGARNHLNLLLIAAMAT